MTTLFDTIPEYSTTEVIAECFRKIYATVTATDIAELGWFVDNLYTFHEQLPRRPFIEQLVYQFTIHGTTFIRPVVELLRTNSLAVVSFVEFKQVVLDEMPQLVDKDIFIIDIYIEYLVARIVEQSTLYININDAI